MRVRYLFTISLCQIILSCNSKSAPSDNVDVIISKTTSTVDNPKRLHAHNKLCGAIYQAMCNRLKECDIGIYKRQFDDNRSTKDSLNERCVSTMQSMTNVDCDSDKICTDGGVWNTDNAFKCKKELKEMQCTKKGINVTLNAPSCNTLCNY